MALRFAWVGVLAVAAAASAAAGAENEYTIKLSRPVKAGEVYQQKITAVRESREMVAAGGKQESKQTVYQKLELEGRVTIVSPDKAGDPGVFTLTVDKCNDGAGKDYIAPGTTVTVERVENGIVYKVGAKPLPEEGVAALNLAYRPAPKDAITDDDEFPTKAPVKAGDRWPIDAAVSVKRAAEAGQAIPKEDIHGMARLKEVRKEGGTVTLVVSTNVDVVLRVPPGSNIKELSIKGESTYLLPVDPATPGFDQEMVTRFRKVSAGKTGGQEVAVTEVTVHVVMTPAK